MHPLRKYLKKNNIYQHDFAKILGISEKHLSKIVNNKTGVSLELAVAIQKQTGNEISAADLIQKSA